uniref:Integrase catalytic domain-containing protein n=1 Tax=Tanacetum cinerariifolium TaxID=118510 RepID=A0A699HLV1_TANCI|nr:hypothetical protein [Tanacetum cinerariifolium]
MSDHEEETINEENAHPKVVPQIITVTNIFAKFSYLKKGDDKSITTDKDGNLKIRSPVTTEEHQQVQREEKARIILLSALPDEHIGDFYHMIDARVIWNAIKARFGGLEYISFNDLYNKLKFLEIDTKGYTSSFSTLSNASFVSTAGSSQGNFSYQESRNGGYGGHTTTITTSSGSSYSKGSSKSKCSVVDDVIYSFFANHEIEQQLVYEDLDKINKEEFEEYDLKHQMAMLSIKVHRFEKKHGRKIKFNGGENARFDKKLKYKSKEARKDRSDSKAMVVVDGSIDWDQQTNRGNTEPRSLENFSMIAGIKIKPHADSEGEVVFADDVIPAGTVAATVISPQSETEFALMGLSTEAKWNNNGKNLYKLIDSSMFVRTKRGLRLNKYIGEGELGIDDFKFSIFYISSDKLKGKPIYNRFASVDHMKAVPPPITGNYMSPSNIPDIDESQLVYGKKAPGSSKIKTNDDSITHTNDSVLFDFSDWSSEPSTNDLKMCDSCVECSRPNHSDHDYTFSVSAPASKSRDTIVIDCDKQEDFLSVFSIETDVKTSIPLCNKFESFNKESHIRKHKSIALKSCYVCGSYLHLIKDCDFHEQTFAKRKAKGKGKLGRRPTGKQVNQNRPNPVSAGQPNPVSAGQPNPVSAGNGILGLRPLNIQTKSKYFYSFTHNNQQIIFPTTHNSLYSLYMTDGLNGKTALKPSIGWPLTHYGMSKTKGSKINGGSKSKSWSYAKGPLGNKDKLKDFEYFDGGEVTFRGSTIRDQSHRVFFTENECLVLFKDFPLPDPSMVILSIPRKHNLRLGHVNLKNINRLVKGNLVRGLPSKVFQNNHTCVACNKGKQHKASYKAIPSISLITEPLHLLYIDLFGPTSVSFITLVENQFNHKVKAIGCDNGTEFKNANMIEFCGSKGIRRDYSNAKTPQQNEVVERKNQTLIEAVRTMLADSLIPTIFLSEAVATACYVLNRVLVTKPYHKTLYELLTGDKPSISYLKPFGSHVTILNTDDSLGKFDKKSDERYIVRYSISSKAYRVYNLVSRKIDETMNLNFLENKPFVVGTGQAWMFDIDYLTKSLNYSRISSTNLTAGSQGATPSNAGKKEGDRLGLAFPSLNPILGVGTASTGSPVSAGSTPQMSPYASPISADRSSVPAGRILRKIFDCLKSGIFTSSSYDEELFGPDANNLASSVDRRNNHLDFQLYMFSCFLSQDEPTTVAQALADPDWVEVMQAEMQQFKNQKVWVLVTLPDEKRAIGTKWILKNKRDARGIVCRNKARIEAIQLFLAFASFIGFKVYQMDVKSAFLYGEIAEEVYVTQHKGFEDPDHPKKVYKVVKAFYGLHQAPKAWYERLSTFLLKHVYRRGTIDVTPLFVKKTLCHNLGVTSKHS